ncbi:alpha/beta hydrolase family protein [Roseibium sediminicola]|uniref:Alpha/beta fold hydrolase n=1 Tax=Roseibium sediminicola TaxID=2933272 RepID=A0ABT0GYP5_9HYPH|nr:alpha/beta fold hydrolase [Roseibium sp. CAU 1639]MCK7614187.1 alpha/beta fold hydrolase [Roseibium sp. CAU 1639]
MTTGAQAGDAPPFGPGVANITIEDARRDRPLGGDIWYPTATPDQYAIADKSKVWKMAPADQDGVPADGVFPLVVVSHGMYGNTLNQAWLGSALARRGFVVAMVNHPGSSTFLRDPDQTRQLWDRPIDLSRLISFLTEESVYKDRIDRERIYAAGHSLGGFTVMLLAGAEFEPGRYERVCASEDLPVACQVLTGWSIAKTDGDRIEMATSRRDPRLAKVISLDLGGTPVLSRDSLGAIDIPVLVLGSGRADMLDQEAESRALAAALPGDKVRHVELDDAGHFDFMGVCKPEGFAILEEHEPGDEIVCIKGNAERMEQHRRILSEILAFLKT